MQTNSVQTDFSRKPWVNTLLYYSFNNQNLNDWSWNWRNWTRYNGAWTYTTWIKWYWVDMWRSHAIQLPMACPSWDFTYSICVKLNSVQEFQSLLWVQQRTSWCIHYHIAKVWTTQWIIVSFYWSTATEIKYTTLPTLNVRHNIILTRSWDVRTIYLDWNQVAQWTKSFSPSQSYQRYVWKEYTDTRYIDWTIDEVIFENTARTSAQVSEYATKILP